MTTHFCLLFTTVSQHKPLNRFRVTISAWPDELPGKYTYTYIGSYRVYVHIFTIATIA
jgi:hypothetical protein